MGSNFRQGIAKINPSLATGAKYERERGMSYRIDGYDVESMGHGFIGIFDWNTLDSIVIDTKEQARDIALLILEKCQEKESEE